jgi:DNA-binding transcriptional LysR family regulator
METQRASLTTLLKKEVEIFLEVARTGSMSVAAPRFNLNQPAISKALKKLESDLKQVLFSRSRNGVTLTQAGIEFQSLVLKLNDLWKLEQKHNRPKHLILGCHPSIAIEFFPTLVDGIRNLFPGTELSFQLLTSLQVTKRVSQLQIDIGVVVNPVTQRQIIVKPIRQDFVSHWAKAESLSHENTPLLVHPDMLYASRIKTGTKEVLQIPDYEVIAEMVKKGSFIGILPSVIAERHGLVQIDKKLFRVDLSLIFHEDRFSREEAKKILRLFQ